MRRVIIGLLRCPQCRRGDPLPKSDTTELLFGPLQCSGCRASFPVAEGIADLVSQRGPVSAVQRGLERPLVARSYERYLRPAVQLGLARRRLDAQSEYLVYRSLLGSTTWPVLDLGCGTGLFSRRLAREPGAAPVVGLDVSRAMLEEAVAQTRESGAQVDYVRAEMPPLPFQDQTLGGILQVGSLHLVEDLPRLLSEVSRTLRANGRYVASSYLPSAFPLGMLHRWAGLHPRGEDELRSAIATAGLVGFERLLLPPFIVIKAEKAPKGNSPS